MEWIYHLLLLVFFGLKIACFVFAVQSGIKGKSWLLTFIALWLCADLGNIMPKLVVNPEDRTMAEYGSILGNASMAAQLLGMIAWVALLGFVLELRGQANAMVKLGRSSLPSRVKRLITPYAASAALVLGGLLGQFAGGLTPGAAPVSLVVVICSGAAAVLIIRGQSTKKIIMGLIGTSFLLLNALTFSSATHWKANGIWLVDWLALALHILAIVLAQQLPKQNNA